MPNYSLLLRDALIGCAVASIAASAVAQTQTTTRTERYTYHDNTTKWVMGQVQSVTCVSSTLDGCNNTVVAEVSYDPVTAQQLSYRSHGKLLQELTYHPDSSVKTVKDGNGKATELSDWYRGVPRLVTYPDTRTEKAGVNELGEIITVFDENGYKTCYQYDNGGRWKQTNYPSETAPTTTCDTSAWNYTKSTFKPSTVAKYGLPAGHWTQVLEVGARRTITYFDGLWRPVLTEDYDATSAATIAATKRFQRFAYDAEGRKTFESYPGTSDALTKGTRSFYDSLGRVTEVKVDSELGVLTTKTEYLDGFKTRVTDPRNYWSTTEYLAFDAPSTEHPKAISHPEGVYTDIARDAYGKPKSITRRNADASTTLTRSYTYNSFNELCRSEEPETGATLTGYDGAGNVKWTASGLPLGTACEASGTSGAVAARRVDRAYDDRNCILTLGFPDGLGNQSWTYTADGLPDTASVANSAAIGPVSSKFYYNARRLLKQEDRTIQGTLYSVKTAFTKNAHVTSTTYPSALVMNHTPNALGQATQASASASAATYHPSGALAGYTYGNSVVRSIELNDRQLPKRLVDCKASGTCTSTGSANAVVDLSYTYDAVGNVQGINDGIINPRQTRSMVYDGLSRLKQAVSSSGSGAPMFGTANYDYDVLDNIKTLSISGGSQPRNHAHCYNSKNQLTELRTGSCSGALVKSLSYDVQGNLANQAGQAFNFDFGNRLRQATGKETYGYDHAGRRAVSCDSVSGQCAHFFYDNSGQLLYTHDARDNKRVDHIYLGKQLVNLRQRPLSTPTVTHRYQHPDALGTPIAETGATQNLLAKFEYEPYGQLVNGTLQNGPGYTGHVQDKATGLTYMQQRYYEPGLGRFLSVDPVTTDAKSGGHFNRYTYAENNPYRYRDPDGRAIETPWDAANVALGIVSTTKNLASGNYAAAAADAVGTLIDIVATAVPGVPGGASTAIQTARVADKVVDAAKTADKVGDVAKVEKTASGKRVGDFKKSQKEAAKAENAAANGGQIKCTDCGKAVESIKSEKGVTTPKNQAQVHHDPAIKDGGGQHSKPVVVCPDCHKDRH